MPVKKKFKAFIIENDKKHGVKDIDLNFLMEGNVLVKVSYSSFNYKDGLAIVKKIPIINIGNESVCPIEKPKSFEIIKIYPLGFSALIY